jgi:outer membrane immunogenic protein
MKKLLLAGVGVFALSAAVPATAADLPARMPAKAPAYVAPIFSWTGFYVGGHVGWARVDLTETISAAPAGFPTGSFGDDESGFIYGGQIGFNWQINQFVIGVEGQLSGADIGRTVTITAAPGVGAPAGTATITATGTASVDWIATLAARFGVAFGQSLLFAKVGAAWLDWSSSASATAFTAGGLVLATAAATGGGTETGWMVGLGFEHAFTPNWSAKIEYNYMDFGDSRTGAAGLVVDTDLTTHLVKVGVNYRFGPF